MTREHKVNFGTFFSVFVRNIYMYIYIYQLFGSFANLFEIDACIPCMFMRY